MKSSYRIWYLNNNTYLVCRCGTDDRQRDWPKYASDLATFALCQVNDPSITNKYNMWDVYDFPLWEYMDLLFKLNQESPTIPFILPHVNIKTGQLSLKSAKVGGKFSIIDALSGLLKDAINLHYSCVWDLCGERTTLVHIIFQNLSYKPSRSHYYDCGIIAQQDLLS